MDATQMGDNIEIAEEFSLESGVEVPILAPVPAKPAVKSDNQAVDAPVESEGEKSDESPEVEVDIVFPTTKSPDPVAPTVAMPMEIALIEAEPTPVEEPSAVEHAKLKPVEQTTPLAPTEATPKDVLLASAAHPQKRAESLPMQAMQAPARGETVEGAEPIPPKQNLATPSPAAPVEIPAAKQAASLAPPPQTTLPIGEASAPIPEMAVQTHFGWSDPAAPTALTRPMALTMPDAQRAQRVAVQIAGSLRSAETNTLELRLDPPELGRVLIQMTTQDGDMRAIVTTERAETAELMRRHADVLARELARAGLSGADLSFQSEAEQRQTPRMAAAKPAAQGAGALKTQAGLAVGVAPTLLDGRLDIRL